MIYPLKNIIQDFPWGSVDSINNLFGIPNPENKPQAELWMGAHPNGCSVIKENELLSDYIATAPESILGQKTYQEFGELPYLMKILAAAQPLSIQVHPSKEAAEKGFAKENAAGIGLKDFNRNYKDANHKPELVYALTPYLAMNAFRQQEEIVELFEIADAKVLADDVAALKADPSSEQLKAFFDRVMSLQGEEKNAALADLLNNIEIKAQAGEQAALAFTRVQDFNELYSGDAGLFAPLMLNVVELQPGEAMFLYAETPHAYLRGTGIEIMANSDNVLRAGLTPKFMDVPELVENIKFQPVKREDLLMQPAEEAGRLIYPIPVKDFRFDVVDADKANDFSINSAEILLCLKGEFEVKTADQSVTVKKGESIFIGADTASYAVSGAGLSLIHI